MIPGNEPQDTRKPCSLHCWVVRLYYFDKLYWLKKKKAYCTNFRSPEAVRHAYVSHVPKLLSFLTSHRAEDSERNWAPAEVSLGWATEGSGIRPGGPESRTLRKQVQTFACTQKWMKKKVPYQEDTPLAVSSPNFQIFCFADANISVVFLNINRIMH